MKNRSHHAIALFLVLLVVWLVSSPAADIHAPRTKIPADFYQVIIITNNLFRPLGWSNPKPGPAFELISTVMKSNNQHKALIRNTRNRTLCYVVMGAEIEPGVRLAKVEKRSVTLNNNGAFKAYRLKW